MNNIDTNIDEEIDLKSSTDAAFNNKSIGLEHVKQEINISEENINGSSDNKFKPLKQAHKNDRKCPICGILTRNISRHKKIHLAPEERQLFACTDCGKKYTTKQLLQHHLETNHINARPKNVQRDMHKCSICGYQTRNMSYFGRHQKTHLAPEKRKIFACVHCEKKYTSNRNLRRHVEDYHLDSRSEDAQKNIRKCSICGYQTRNTTHFGRHQMIHLAPEERQLFACAFCAKKYRNKHNLKHHIEKKHNVSRSKKVHKKIYRCSICSYQTLRKFHFKIHKNIHLPPEERPMFPCAQCDKKYTSNTNLQDHVKRGHSRLKGSQRKVRCSTCDYQTRRMANLRRHEAIHLAPKERQLLCCMHCDRKYRTKGFLKRHLESNHIGSRNADCIPPVEEVILDSLKIEINDHAPLSDQFKNAECPAVTNEVKSDVFIKTEPDDVGLSPNKDMQDDFKNSDCLSVTNEVKSDDFIKTEPDYVALSLNKDMHDDFKNSECLSETNEVKSENFIKTEPDYVALSLNKDMHDDFKNSECLSETNEVKSENFIKTEPDYVALSLNKDMHDDFKNSECLSETNEVKSEDFIKTEPDYVALSLNKDMHDDFKNSECLSETNEVKSENFIKTEPDDVTPLLNKDMYDDLKNSENVSVTQKVKLEDFIKMEPDDGAPFLDEDANG